jgi:tRNA (guanine-N7-)-methyltransferase
MDAPPSAAPRLLLYGRRRGRTLRPGRRSLVAATLPGLSFTLPFEGALDPRALFVAPVDAVWLELGFGGGEHLAAQAAANPATGMIGAEIFENGVAKLVAEIARQGLGNVRIFADDARRLVAGLAERSIARAFILFPDPWPKERHKKRRLVVPDFLPALARVLKDGAELRLATDDIDYARQILALLTDHRDFRWLATGPGDWRTRPADWPATRFEHKAIAAGRKPLYLRFARR